MTRLVWSFVALPLVASLVLISLAALLAPPGHRLQAVLDSRYQALWFLLFAYAALAFLATPLLVIALRKGWLSWWHAVVAGGLVGMLTFAPMYLSQLFDARLHLHYRVGRLSELAEPAVIGAAHGLLFWLLALWRNTAVRNRHQGQRGAA